MQYFFKQHEEDFKEWRRSGYPGIPNDAVVFIKHINSSSFKFVGMIGYDRI